VRAGGPRLTKLLIKYKPQRVWILGKSQGHYSARACEAVGVPYQVIAHPTGKNNMRDPVLPAHILQSWNDLHAARSSCADATAMRNAAAVRSLAKITWTLWVGDL
jgi:hypothetical protein